MQNLFKNKRVLVMGLGLHGGGAGSVKFLATAGARLTVTDLRTRQELAPSLKALKRFKHIRYVLGRHNENDFTSADLIVKNPGVRQDSPHLAAGRKAGVPITSDAGIFFSLWPGRIIGITGTRGKSTTAHLIWKFLRARGRRVFLAGNIRKSMLDFLERPRKSDIIVLELSSFQLHDLAEDTWIPAARGRSPEIAVLTNILRDHLNWHHSMREYRDAKAVIFRYQRAGDYLFANGADPVIMKLVKGAHSRVRFPTLPRPLRPIVRRNLGAHYESSAGLAVAVAQRFGIPMATIRRTLEQFTGLDGREQEIATIRGIHFVNDTTSTVPDATIAAIARFRVRTRANRLILIAGGQDKKLNFRPLGRAIKKSVDNLVLLPGSATGKIKIELGMRNYELGKIKEARSMNEAVHRARRMARAGDYVLLSPGAASFGLFLNEFDRGDQFVNEVKKIK